MGEPSSSPPAPLLQISSAPDRPARGGTPGLRHPATAAAATVGKPTLVRDPAPSGRRAPRRGPPTCHQFPEPGSTSTGRADPGPTDLFHEPQRSPGNRHDPRPSPTATVATTTCRQEALQVIQANKGCRRPTPSPCLDLGGPRAGSCQVHRQGDAAIAYWSGESLCGADADGRSRQVRTSVVPREVRLRSQLIGRCGRSGRSRLAAVWNADWRGRSRSTLFTS